MTARATVVYAVPSPPPLSHDACLSPTWLPAMSTGLEMPNPMRSFSLAEANLPSRSSRAEMPKSSNALHINPTTQAGRTSGTRLACVQKAITGRQHQLQLMGYVVRTCRPSPRWAW